LFYTVVYNGSKERLLIYIACSEAQKSMSFRLKQSDVAFPTQIERNYLGLE